MGRGAPKEHRAACDRQHSGLEGVAHWSPKQEGLGEAEQANKNRSRRQANERTRESFA